MYQTRIITLKSSNVKCPLISVTTSVCLTCLQMFRTKGWQDYAYGYELIANLKHNTVTPSPVLYDTLYKEFSIGT